MRRNICDSPASPAILSRRDTTVRRPLLGGIDLLNPRQQPPVLLLDQFGGLPRPWLTLPNAADTKLLAAPIEPTSRQGKP
jgi:hypothetical protein